MRRRFTFKVIPVLAFCSAACGDNAGPLAGASLCADGLWAGIQRQNQGWKTIPATEARVTLSPGEKITLARIGLTDSLQIFFITAEQAQATFPCVSPTKDLSGPIVQGLDFTGSRFGARGLVSIGHSSSFLSQGSGFTLHYV
ncbi:MAG TPA: hypothetical protein VJS39_04470, partial [Gemmatimonadaceae bacterium]|nr:hypothetical protein [Gemmatimonadaceae bacterium]